MRHRFVLALTVAAFGIGCAGNARRPSAGNESPEAVAKIAEKLARSPTGWRSDEETATLRANGPAALDIFLADVGSSPSADQKKRIDEIAQQRDAYGSHLYWYTDFAEAERAAKASGRPILSLRMLGNLTDELSCANSRFFRTALYPDPSVQKVMHDEFILYWSSERPAPTMTIDFHDGRKIERTVTGNSIHYILDSDGRPIDALPGLYAPAQFVTHLRIAAGVASNVKGMPDDQRAAFLRDYHGGQFRSASVRWSDELKNAGVPARPLALIDVSVPERDPRGITFINANVGVPVAMGKSMVERPLVRAVVPQQNNGNAAKTAPEGAMLETIPWRQIADYAGVTKLSDASRAMIRAKRPMDWSDETRGPRALTDAELETVIDGFEHLMNADSLKNEEALHASIHAWFMEQPNQDFATLNKRVYDKLFLTPRSDPWLGLVPPATFTGLQDDGVIAR